MSDTPEIQVSNCNSIEIKPLSTKPFAHNGANGNTDKVVSQYERERLGTPPYANPTRRTHKISALRLRESDAEG
jgi:hypothetical protein